jgi:sugar phosphate permease
MFITVYFGPLFFAPVEVLGPRTAGLVTGVGNLFANMGALTAAYGLGVVKDVTGSFAWGFLAIAMLCVIGTLLTIELARIRKSALAAPRERPDETRHRRDQPALLASAARKT